MPCIEDILHLERIDTDIFRGAAFPSKLKRTFGGQVAAQALVAAVATVADERTVHSLHGYFLRPGRSEEPTVFLVDRLRDGRSFSARAVRAVQGGQTIFSMQASFHRRGDHGPDHSDQMRKVPPPEGVPELARLNPDRVGELLKEWGDWDLRVVSPDCYESNKYAASQQVVWFRSRHKLPDAAEFHQCTLAYMSDMTLLHSALVPHPGQEVQMASLDHALWFVREFRADDWLLYDQTSPSAHSGRALTSGRIFNRAGELVAVATQEGLVRTSRG